MAKKSKVVKQEAKAEKKGFEYNPTPNKMDVSCASYEWIKKDLGTVSTDGLYKLVGIEMNGGAGLIIEHWLLI